MVKTIIVNCPTKINITCDKEKIKITIKKLRKGVQICTIEKEKTENLYITAKNIEKTISKILSKYKGNSYKVTKDKKRTYKFEIKTL